MHFKWAKHSEFVTEWNIGRLDYWHILKFLKMGRTYTELEIPPYMQWAKYTEFDTELGMICIDH